MSQKNQRTSIEDISPVGEELSGEQVRLVNGGLMIGGFGKTPKKTHSPGTDYDKDTDDTNYINDTLPVASFF
jgi:hypothetical protein